MSINVTVTGNPVSINRGRMVTACSCNDPQKEEFERRRLMRLEQVRQQSKEIAENVRKKVRNEKKKQCTLFEKENEKKLKDWQARKLLELHSQYKECLKDIGLGHKEAEVIDVIEKDIQMKKQLQAQIAEQRGKLARERMRCCSAAPIQKPQKPLTRDIRSAEESRMGTYGARNWCKCKPKKHFYTVVDKPDDETPIQVSLKTSDSPPSYKTDEQIDGSIEEISEESTSGDGKGLQDDNLSEVSEETISTTSERFVREISGASGGSSPRRFDSEVERSRVRYVSPQHSAGDALEGYMGTKVGFRGNRQRKSFETDETSGRFRAGNIAGTSGSKKLSKTGVSIMRTRPETIEELSENADELDDELRPKGPSQKLAQKDKSRRGGSPEKIAKSRSRQIGSQEEADLREVYVGPKKSKSQKANYAFRKETEIEKSSERVVESRGSDIEEEADDFEEYDRPSKSRSQRVTMTTEREKSRERSMQKVTQRGFGSQETADDAEIYGAPSKSRSYQKGKTKEKSLQRIDEGDGKGFDSRFDQDVEDDAETTSKSRSFQKAKSKEKSVQRAAEDDAEIQEAASKSRSFQKVKSKEKGFSSRFDQDAEDDAEIHGAPSKSRSQRAVEKEKSAFEPEPDDSEDYLEPSKSRSQKDKGRPKSVQKIAESRTGTFDLQVEEEAVDDQGLYQGSVRSQKKIRDGSGTQLEQDGQLIDDTARRTTSKLRDDGKDSGGRGRRGVGGRGDSERDLQSAREPSGRYSRRNVPDEQITSSQGHLETTATRTSSTAVQYPLETRISDRIKHRSSLVTKPDDNKLIDELEKEPSRRIVPSDPNLTKPVQRRDTDTQVTPIVAQKEQSTTLDGAGEKRASVVVLKEKSREGVGVDGAGEIPERPSIALVQKRTSGGDGQKGHVERISKEDLQVVTDYGVEEDFLKKMQRQDREAEERGKIALQKEKTKRSYEEMMKKLPSVQKQERLSRISLDKPEYYMSKERLKEVEQKRQFDMENAFESAFPNLKPNLITSEKVTQRDKMEKDPFRMIDITDQTPGVKIGNWDAARKHFGIDCECCPHQSKREKQLRDLLLNLQTQKELLLQEVDSLPQDSRLNELLGSLHDMGVKKRTSKSKKHSEKKRSLQDTSPTTSSTSSPRKKSKTNVLIRQNTSTQTSPLTKTAEVQSGGDVEKVEKATSPRVESPTKTERICEKTGKICECKRAEQTEQEIICAEGKICKLTGQICEGEEDKVCEIVIKIRESETQPEIVVKPAENLEATTKKKVVVEEKKPKSVKTSTWSEHFSQTSTTITSTSTSYYSPPDVSARMRKSRPRDLLHDKPKQTNFASSRATSSTRPCRTTQTGRKLHPFIIKYIEKLLTISRNAVDELSVSSVSDVTTPATSVTETSANNPTMVHLQKLLKRLGITYEELCELYGKSGKHDKVLSSLSSGSTHSTINDAQSRVDPCDTHDEQTNTSLSAKVSQEEVVEDDKNYQEMMMKYAEITEGCNKRISDLTEKIEKVRMEKMQIMNSSEGSSGGVDKENNTTTAYLDLPNTTTDTGSGGSSIVEQEKLDKMVLTIDQNLAENLKRMTSSEIREKYADKAIQNIGEDTISETNQPQDFEPLLKDIPKLPKFSEPICDPFKCMNNNNNNKRPPPSKGLTIAKRFNEEITTVPHELSTIIEGDSQLSTKAPKSNENVGDDDVIVVEKQAVDVTGAADKQTRFDDQIQVQQQQLSSSSDEMQSLEAMLKEMGMGWAVATLRKTQEALALASSSSSLDINIQQLGGESSGSEISLKGVLSRHLLTKFSSTSTSTTETSVSMLMREFEDISAILGSGSTTMGRDGQHRTSTPIQSVVNGSKSQKCECSDRSGDGAGGGSNDGNSKPDCTFHSLHSSGSVTR